MPRLISADEFVATLADLPLAFQPGDGWLYDTPIDVLGVLLVRATGKSLSTLFDERIIGPLGMASTSFWTQHVDRLATAYFPGPDGLTLLDPPDGAFAQSPRVREPQRRPRVDRVRRPPVLRRDGRRARARC